jgi:hypothetical protein
VSASGPIQSPAFGLLGMLALKNRGNLPEVLQDSVQPIIDVDAYYKASQAEYDQTVHTNTVVTATAPGANGYVAAIRVPQGQTWWVLQYTVEIILPAGAGELIEGAAPILVPNSAVPTQWVGLSDQSVSMTGNAASTNQRIITVGNFWAPSGADLSYYFGRLVSLGTVINGRVRRTALVS